MTSLNAQPDRNSPRPHRRTTLRQYGAVTAAYWGFTVTDGALRMLVLLHFHRLGFSPIDLAFLFLLYEAMGVVTNALGGWLGSRYGLRLTLFLGLSAQVIALLALSVSNPAWAVGLSVAYVMGCQAVSGIAKDLTKMSSKSAIKSVVADLRLPPATADGTTPQAETDSVLFKWVSLLTGSKNALKGLGFFVGGLLLETIGFQGALWLMAAGLVLILLACVGTVRRDLGRAKVKPTGLGLFSKSRAINLLSAARLFLFASRDIWFVVGLPIFLATAFGWGFDAVGGFMAAWIIGYGIIQASAPGVLRKTRDQRAGQRAALVWVSVLGLVMTALAILTTPGWVTASGALPDPLWIVGGLFLFGAVFALNSAVHSWLVVSLADEDSVALTVGFYYMANAWGRLLGTLLSGLVYAWGLGAEQDLAWGLASVLWGSCILVALAMVFTAILNSTAPRVQQGHANGTPTHG